MTMPLAVYCLFLALSGISKHNPSKANIPENMENLYSNVCNIFCGYYSILQVLLISILKNKKYFCGILHLITLQNGFNHNDGVIDRDRPCQ